MTLRQDMLADLQATALSTDELGESATFTFKSGSTATRTIRKQSKSIDRQFDENRHDWQHRLSVTVANDATAGIANPENVTKVTIGTTEYMVDAWSEFAAHMTLNLVAFSRVSYDKGHAERY